MASLIRSIFRSPGFQKQLPSTSAISMNNLLNQENCKNNTRISSSRSVIHASQYAPISIPDQDLFSFLTTNFTFNKSKTVAIESTTGRHITYGEFLYNSRSVASALIKRGVQPHDVVAIAAPNCYEYMISMLGTFGACASLTMVNQALTASEMENQLRATKAKLVITTSEFLPLVTKAVELLPTEIIEIGSSFSDLLQDNGSAMPSEMERRSIVDPKSHVALIPYSSGTTGMPKGVMLSHYSAIANVLQLTSSADLLCCSENRSKWLGLLPFWHVSMMISLMIVLHNGNLCCLMPKFDPVALLGNISKYKLDYLPLVPPIVVFLAKHPLVDQFDLSSINEAIVGAAPLSADLQKEFSDRLRIPVVRQAWGMSETWVGTMTSSNEVVPGTCGTIMPNTELKIVSPEDRQVVLSTGDGEVAIRGPQIMKGYLSNIAATMDIIDNEGWLYTGDIGHMSDKKQLVIVDRLKELIKYKGHQVAPAELEGVLLTHPSVADAAVIGIPDPEVGELPRAYVQLKSGVVAIETEVENFVAERVGAISRLRGGVEFIDIIPKNGSGKILRRKLKENYQKNQIG